MKFGLIVPDKKKQQLATSAPIKVASVFADDNNDDEEEELAALRRAKATTSVSTTDSLVEKIQMEALKEDPNIFDYDAALEVDDLQRKTVHRNSRYMKTTTTTTDPKSSDDNKEPKYMKNILAKAEERKIESELIKLRNMKRKATEEGADPQSLEGGEEEVFVTSAYKKRLEELDEMEKDLKVRQIREEEGDVSKRGDMNGFYYNLMKRNVSFGGKLRDSETSKRSEAVRGEPVVTSKDCEPEPEPVPVTSNDDESSQREQVVFGPRRPPIKK